MLIADALRSVPALGKAFTPGDVPQQPGVTVSWRLPREADPAKKVGDGGGASITGAVLNWYYRNFPEAEPRVSSEDRQGQQVYVIPHALTDLLDTPNEYYDGDALWAGLIYSYILDGNGYWLKARNASGRVAELWWVPHQLIGPKPEKDPNREGARFIAHYEYLVSGRRYEIDPSEVVHVRFGIDPKDPRKGISPLKQQLRELLTDEEAALFSAAMVQNIGVPGVMVSPRSENAQISEADARATKARFEQEFTGQNRGRVMVMSGATVVEQLGFSPEQLTLRTLRAIPEERVSAALGVPAAVVGLGTGLAQTTVGATLAQLREMATESALVPMWRTFARQVEGALMHEFSGGNKALKLRFDTSEVRVLQEDRQRLHERTREDMRAGMVDVATAQARLGYPVDERQRVYLRSPLMLEVPAAPAGVRGQRERGGAKRSSNGKLTDAQRAGLAFVRYIDQAARPIASAFETRLTGAFEQLGVLAEDAYRDARKGRKQDPTDAEVIEVILGALRMEEYIDLTLGPVYGGVYEATARIVIDGVEQALGVTLAIGVQDTVAARVIAEGGRRLGLLDLTEQTRDALFRALEQARLEGLGVPETARRIRDLVPAGPFPAAGVRYRAETIARTEMMWARNISVAETGRAAGFERYVAFDNRTGFDDETCPIRDGQEFTYDEMLGEDEHPRGTLSFSPIPRTTA